MIHKDIGMNRPHEMGREFTLQENQILIDGLGFERRYALITHKYWERNQRFKFTIRLGCSHEAEHYTLIKIGKKYGKKSPYGAMIKAACRELERQHKRRVAQAKLKRGPRYQQK